MALQKRSLTQTQIREEYLLVQAAQNNPRRFSVLYEKYYEQIFCFVYKRIDDTELTGDVTSQVFLKAMTNLKKYRFQGVPFSAWLYRIAINEVNQHFRSNKHVRTISMESTQVAEMMEEVEEPYDEIHIQRMLQVMQQLSEEEVQMIELRFFERLPFKEIAQIFNISENNAKVKMYRLLGKMKKLMGTRQVEA